MLRKWIAALAAVLLAVPFGMQASAADEDVRFYQTGSQVRAVSADSAEVILQNVLDVKPDSVYGGEEDVVYVLSPMTYTADAASFAVCLANTADVNRVQESRYKLYEFTEDYEKGRFTGEVVDMAELLERGIVAPDNPVREEKYWEILPNRGSGTLKLAPGRYVVMLSDTEKYGSGNGWQTGFQLIVVDSPDSSLVADVKETISVPGEGQWEKLSNGKTRFRCENGTLVSDWQQIAGKWYFFRNFSDEDGDMYDMQTGWKDGLYLKPDGSLQTGWFQRDGDWYYADDATRKLRTGWLQDKGKWYYLDPATGKMHIGWLWQDGSWYYLGLYGMYDNGWKPVEGSTEGVYMLGDGWRGFHYFRSDGRMAVGWQQIGEEWYYFREDGSRYHGWLCWQGDWYYLNDGRMLADTMTPDGYQVDAQGIWQP